MIHANFGLHARPSCVSHDNDDCECNTIYEARQIKLLCGLVAKAEGSDMHAPDDDMYRQMVLDDDVQAQNFVEKLLTPDDKCRLVLNLRFAPPMCVDGSVVSVLGLEWKISPLQPRAWRMGYGSLEDAIWKPGE